MKKIISLLTVALCLIAMSGAVTAEGNDSLTPRQSIAISLLNDIGIFSEVSEESAGETVTRADFARVVVRMLGAEDELSTAPRRIYTDVLPDNEAAASIEYLYDKESGELLASHEDIECEKQTLTVISGLLHFLPA